MQETAAKEQIKTNLESLNEALQSGAMQQVRRILNGLHPAEIGRLLESMPPSQRLFVWEMVDEDDRGEVLVQVGDEVQAGLIDNMEEADLLAATEGLDMDDLADLLVNLPDAVTRQALDGMDHQHRQRLEAVLSYDEDSAGGLMNPDTVTVRADVTLDVVLRYLRAKGNEIPSTTDSLFVVNRYDRYLGILPLSLLVTSDPNLTVADVMSTEVEGIPALIHAHDVAKVFQDRDLISAPVLDDQGRLLGRITIDDVVDVIRDQADHSVMSMAGLTEEDDLFAPVLPSARHRAIWLGVNLLTAFIAAWVIGLFKGSVEQIVALAVLLPIVPSMGGIAGSQTLTLVIRGLALGHVDRSNARLLMLKEAGVGLFNGIAWSLVVGIVAGLWFSDTRLGTIIGVAMIINLLIAALAGVLIPLLLRRINIDPALAGGVILTTITDVIGLFAFLGLATILLL